MRYLVQSETEKGNTMLRKILHRDRQPYTCTFKSFIFEINSFIKKFEYHVKFATGHKIEWIMMSPNNNYLDHFL